MINELAEQVHQNARDKGFFDNERNIGEMLALIHSEVSEALEADRKNHYANKHDFIGWHNRSFDKSFDEWNELAKKSFEETIKNSFEDELADIMIRIMDLAAYKGINLEYHIKAKMRYNSLREKMHGKKY